MSKGNRKKCVFVKVSCKHAHTSNTVTEPYIQPDSVKFYHGCIVVVCIIHTRMLTRMDVMCLTWA